MNQEFPEYMRLWSISKTDEERSQYIELMRENLIARNSGENVYLFGYTEPGRKVDIAATDNIQDLFAVNSDMNPLGL